MVITRKNERKEKEREVSCSTYIGDKNFSYDKLQIALLRWNLRWRHSARSAGINRLGAVGPRKNGGKHIKFKDTAEKGKRDNQRRINIKEPNSVHFRTPIHKCPSADLPSRGPTPQSLRNQTYSMLTSVPMVEYNSSSW